MGSYCTVKNNEQTGTAQEVNLNREAPKIQENRSSENSLSISETGKTDEQRLTAALSSIESITANFAAPSIARRLKALPAKSPDNAATICEYILAQQCEQNLRTSTIESQVKALLLLSEYLEHEAFRKMNKPDLLKYLNHLRNEPSIDPAQRWVGTYNQRLRVYLKFFRWLYNPDQPDHKLRKTPPCIQGLRQLNRNQKSPYKPSDLWDGRDHRIFLTYCPDPRDRCYHAMAMDTSARPHELLNLRIKDIIFKKTESGTQYAEILVTGGKTAPRSLPLIHSLPYVKDWIDAHPLGRNAESWLFISKTHSSFGKRLKGEGLLARYQYYYKKGYFPDLLNRADVPETDKSLIRNLLAKPWALYVLRHSGLTEKSTVLTESVLRNYAGWTMTSDMPSRYVHYYGSESSRKILEAEGILKRDATESSINHSKPCPHCGEPNTPDSIFCRSCRFALSLRGYSDAKSTERIQTSDFEERVQKIVKEKMQQLLAEIDFTKVKR